jgi:hypothetical protein
LYSVSVIVTQELGYEIAKVKECFVYWNSDVALWEKHNMVIPTRPISKPIESGTHTYKSVEFNND